MPSMLIVDDEKWYSQFLDQYLSVIGFDSFLASSGEDGLEFFQTARPDLIMLDWCLKMYRLYQSRIAARYTNPCRSLM